MNSFLHKLADLTLEIEAEMRRQKLWEEQSPPTEALQSLMPFCHNTLSFNQWLQWVFLSKIKASIESEIDIPSHSEMAPLAEYAFERLKQDTTRLLQLIEAIDQSINRR